VCVNHDQSGLAWALSEFIAKELQSYCMFATHFHELTSLSEEAPELGVVNYHVSAHTTDTSITMQYEVQPGPCLRSFGIHVAEMAKFPAKVLEEAKRKANELENFKSPSIAALKRHKPTADPGASPGNSLVLTKESKQLVVSFLQKFTSIPLEKVDTLETRAKVSAFPEFSEIEKLLSGGQN